MADSFDGERDAGMLFDAALALQEAERARFDVRRTAALVSLSLIHI